MTETFVEKYISDKLSDFENLSVEDFPLFVNGKKVGDGSGKYLIVCSEPFPRNLVLVGIEEGNEFKWLDFAVYDRKKEDWLIFDYKTNWSKKEKLL